MFARVLALGLLLSSFGAFAQDVFLPPPLEEDRRPALVYKETNPETGADRLFLAYRRSDAWQRALLTGVGYARAFPLGGPKLLVSAGEDADQSRIHLLDLEEGTLQIISGRRGLDPLDWQRPGERVRHWPENNTVFIFQDSETEETVEFITIEYGTMESKADMIPKERLGTPWNIDNAVRIAANGAHFAWAEDVGPVEDWEGARRFQLKTFHFNDRSVSTEDDNVVTKVTGSPPFGPAFGWSDFNELTYATLSPDAGDRAVFSFRKVDVHRHTPEEIFPELLPLTRDGGNIYRDNALRALIFVHTGEEDQSYVLDAPSMTLFPRPAPEALRLTRDGGMSQVVDGTRLLLNTEEEVALGASVRTPRSGHRAFTLTHGESGRQQLMAVVADGDPEELTAGDLHLEPLMWIE